MGNIIEAVVMGFVIVLAFIIGICILVVASPFIILGYFGFELLTSGMDFFESRKEKRKFENTEDII